ncbi:hypothetical protein [Demequina zhanjiangensis]|uniref:Uncharacterized protein n=1 Tax=Demequina zhanjiangensis TaxID=3051659 RepID=A0ABT8G130_9MICO|nr:hypothetical protein [Demequina sp. SYSU T00b26]MDN4472835.1 hypothetical protein [Demequina sp. SYSU T00b26]
MNLQEPTGVTKSDRRVTRTFTNYSKFRRTGKQVQFGIVGMLGTPQEAREWIRVLPSRSFWAMALLCPAIVSDARTYAIGFGPDQIATVQFAPVRLPPARRLRFYNYYELTVTDRVDGEYTEIILGSETFQVGHREAVLVRDLLQLRQ